MDTEVGRRVACEGGRHIVDVTAAPVVVDHAAHRQLVRDQRQIEDSGDVRIRVTARGHAVTSGNAPLGHVELRLVRDVANDAGLGARTEQRPLGPFKDLDALQVGRVDIQVAAGQLPGLLVQIDGNVRKAVDRAAGLSCDVAGAETPHEDLILAWSRGWRDHIGQVLEQIVEVRDIQLLQGIASKRLDCDRHVLGVLTAPLRRDDDFLNATLRLVWRCCRVRGSSGMSAEDRGNRTSAFLIDLHWQTPRRHAAAEFVQGRATRCRRSSLLAPVQSVAPESRCFSRLHIAYSLRLDTALDFWSIVSSWRAAHCSRHSECLIP